MTAVAQDKVVSIEYTLTGPDGAVIDSSEGYGPLEYIHGKGMIIVGLESALEGKAVGDALKVEVQPEEGYGVRNDEMVITIPMEHFEEVGDVEIGMQFQVNFGHATHLMTVVSIEEDGVVADGNHPLAGLVLNFDVKVVDIREATEEELEQGHLHQEGCCGCGDNGDDCGDDKCCDDGGCGCGC